MLIQLLLSLGLAQIAEGGHDQRLKSFDQSSQHKKQLDPHMYSDGWARECSMRYSVADRVSPS